MGRNHHWKTGSLLCLVLSLLLAGPGSATARAAGSAAPHKKTSAHKTAAGKATVRTVSTRSHSAAASTKTIRTTRTSISSRSRVRATHAVLTVHRTRHRYYERFTGNSFTSDLTQGDVTAGEDPVVRQAAIEALGNMNGTALAIDPSNGRILAMVNQKLALSSGAEPCSTIKLAVSLAALDEGLITKDTPVNIGGHTMMTLTTALAKSINPYFETLGRELGFERVKHYANEFGLGELAGYNIEGEQLGVYPDQPLPDSKGGVGRMCSFGESISMTPLQLGALVTAMANGGTLYYLQHPETPEEVADFRPMVKRTLDIAPLVPEMRDGMEGAVNYGTARSLRATFHEFPVMGKTGTCSNDGTRFGWFASYANTPNGSIVTVIFIEGGRPSFGPHAAELTGKFYRALWDSDYFESKSPQVAETGFRVSPAN
ncbi:MAG TPA: penicillin-binding transpeptidase domain-containing protein [Acidobacteriaceae bacterium]|nr:penicillin-binding transpeptidase domain-containing protein [Acidobacteriaceae bacterium]